MKSDAGTAQRILDVAERLVQTRGYNGFSYADIASALGIRKPSIHHHFPGKAEMGERLVDRYADRFFAALEAITRESTSARASLRQYADLYRGVLRDRNRMCLCGMMAAEISTLPASVRRRINSFFDGNEAWLAGVLAAGRKSGELAFRDTPREVARRLVSSLEGAMLVARSHEKPARFDRHVAGLLADLSA